jgi:glycosyltransferase involved in cell wall biosynthesis
MSLPQLSIILPNYNHGKYLDNSLSAILRQSLQPLEVLVLDDASTDNSVEVIRRIGAQNPLIRLVQNEANLGAMPNANKGVDLARGQYVYIASADDEIMPGLFEKSLRLLAQHPEAAFSCAVGDWHEVATGFNWQMGLGLGKEPCYLSPEKLVELARQEKLFIVSNTAVFHREKLIGVGKFVPELRWHADWFTLYIGAFRHGFCFVPEPLGRLNILPNSFYKAGRRNEAQHEQVLRGIMERLVSPEYAPEAEKIRRGGSLFEFALPMLKILRGDPRFKKFITGDFLRRCLWHHFKVSGKNYLPVWMANLYFQIAGYRAQPSSPR